LHFTAHGDVLGHDPRVRLEAAIDLVNAQYRDAAFCLISGDMGNRGTPADYAALARRLARLEIPYLPLPGNHDRRAEFRRHLALPEGVMEAFIQYEVPLGHARVIGLDSLDPGADGGVLCPVRRDWLLERLAASEAPALVFLHHPPMALGLPMQDADRLAEGESVLDALAETGRVAFLGAGHVHRRHSGVVRGLPFATMASVLYQAPPPVPAWDWESFAPAREAPELALVTVEGPDIRVVPRQICPYETGT
ncbi:MAG: metallophosphoesterase, partial [Pseudomonadota bacterium]